MIFVKVDVTLPRHYRVLDVPVDERAAAIGVWTVANCYTREHELDGFCPLSAIREVATDRVVEHLIAVGLFARAEQDGRHGVTVLRYAEHNETREEIAKRRRGDKKRKMSARNPNGHARRVRSESDRNPVGIQTDNSGAAVGIHDSDSDSVSGSDQGEPEREPDPVPAQPTSPPPLPPLPQPVSLTEPLTEERRQYALTVGLTDVERVWEKFLGKCAEWGRRTSSVDGSWRAFCANELPIQRRERERDRDRSATGPPPSVRTPADEIRMLRAREVPREQLATPEQITAIVRAALPRPKGTTGPGVATATQNAAGGPAPSPDGASPRSGSGPPPPESGTMRSAEPADLAGGIR